MSVTGSYAKEKLDLFIFFVWGRKFDLAQNAIQRLGSPSESWPFLTQTHWTHFMTLQAKPERISIFNLLSISFKQEGFLCFCKFSAHIFKNIVQIRYIIDMLL